MKLVASQNKTKTWLWESTGRRKDDGSGGKKTEDENETNDNASHTGKKLSENRVNQ